VVSFDVEWYTIKILSNLIKVRVQQAGKALVVRNDRHAGDGSTEEAKEKNELWHRRFGHADKAMVGAMMGCGRRSGSETEIFVKAGGSSSRANCAGENLVST
jgi:hypothetical protein